MVNKDPATGKNQIINPEKVVTNAIGNYNQYLQSS